MTMSVEAPRRAGTAGETEAVAEEGTNRGGDATVVLGGGDSRPADPTGARQPRVDDLTRLADSMGLLADPLVMQRLAQRVLRDMQVDSREQGIDVENERAEHAANERAQALAESIAKAKEAEGWGVFAQIAVRVAAVVTAAVCAVAGAFTGGAGVALAVGLIVLAFGADLGLALEECGVDQDVTNAIGIGATIVGTACTFGASTAGAVAAAGAQTGAVAARTAAETAAKIALEIAERSIQALAGSAKIAGGYYERGSAMALADSEEAGLEAGFALDRADGLAEEAVQFMESYQRVVARLTRAAEVRSEAMMAATGRRA